MGFLHTHKGRSRNRGARASAASQPLLKARKNGNEPNLRGMKRINLRLEEAEERREAVKARFERM